MTQTNFVTHYIYTAGNAAKLAAAQQEAEWPEAKWASVPDARTKYLKVIAGQHGIPLHSKPRKVEDAEAIEKAKKNKQKAPEEKMYPGKPFTVFNIAQLEEMPATMIEWVKKQNEKTPEQKAEARAKYKAKKKKKS